MKAYMVLKILISIYFLPEHIFSFFIFLHSHIYSTITSNPKLSNLTLIFSVNVSIILSEEWTQATISPTLKFLSWLLFPHRLRIFFLLHLLLLRHVFAEALPQCLPLNMGISQGSILFVFCLSLIHFH